MHAPLCGVDELRHVAVAGVEAGVGVEDADYGAGESVLGVELGG